MSPETFRSVADFFSEAALLLTREGVVLAANRHFGRLGLGPESPVGRRLAELAATPEKDVRNYLRTCSRNLQPVLGSLRLARVGEEALACRCEGSAVGRDCQGAGELLLKLVPREVAFTRFSMLNQKIAELTEEIRRRQRVQTDLVAERESLRVTLTSIGDAVIVTNAEGLVTLINPVAEALTGWVAEEAEGQPLPRVFDIVNELTRRPAPDPVERVLREGVVVGLGNHTVLLARDGAERPIDDSAAPIRETHGEMIGAVLVFRDVTRRRQAERAMRESEERFTQLADAIPQLAWMARSDGHIDWYNNRWYEYTGTTFEQMEGWGWQSVPDPGTLPEVVRRWEASLASGEPFEMVFPLRGADGQFRPFLTRVMPFRDEDGVLVRWFGTNTDIGELQRIQEELRKVAAKLSEADRRKDAFLATLAHELRNPLAPISMGLEVLKGVSDDPRRVEEIRDMLQRQTRQLVALVDDLLDVSRITRGRLQLRKRAVTLKDVLRSALEAARPLIDEAGHELSVALPEGDVCLDADPHRLAQVFSNLLNNAAKYTPEGGRVAIAAQRQDGDVVVRVTDTGVGIPSEKLEAIFEMFGQVEHPMQHGAGGLGIGLTLAKLLVEMHEGTIDVRSGGAGQGSEFSVRLPVLAESDDAPSSRQAEASPVTVAKRVLVVDDNAAAAKMLSLVVKMLGADVRTAGDGVEALEVAAEFCPDVMFMDIGMPRMNGYETARRIRQQAWGQGVLLVALTGWGQEDDKRRAREAGFDDHLVKPAEAADVRRLLASEARRPHGGS